MTTIGLIGAGNIGSQVARVAVAHGYDVVLSNSRGPETLTELIEELGSHARAATPFQAAQAADLAVVAIPLHAIEEVPVEPLAGKTVIDAGNYYPARDGQVEELDSGSAASSQLLQRLLATSHVVKAFNHIQAQHITEHAQADGTPGRRALIVSGDDEDARDTVAELIDTVGFDVVDIGPLAESWRIQPETPGYGPRLSSDELVEALDAATR